MDVWGKGWFVVLSHGVWMAHSCVGIQHSRRVLVLLDFETDDTFESLRIAWIHEAFGNFSDFGLLH